MTGLKIVGGGPTILDLYKAALALRYYRPRAFRV
jgi:hypothetical protein